MKNDYQQKRDSKDINLSYSQNPTQPQRNQSIELAAKNGLNQSRSINPHQTAVHYQTPINTSSQPNFRIGPLSNNVSREYSSSRRPGANASQDERSKPQGTSPTQESLVGGRRPSKVLLARHVAAKPGLDASAQYPRIHNTPAPADYNLLGTSGRDIPARGISVEQKKTPHVEFKLSDPSGERVEERPRPAIIESGNWGDQSPKAVAVQEKAVVHWADALNGQDIRTELKFGDCLGQGSFAKVYEGFDKKLKIPVAIKVIDKRKIKDTETKKKALIEEEIYIFSRMDHPNISKFIRLIEDVKRVEFIYLDLHSNGVMWI